MDVESAPYRVKLPLFEGPLDLLLHLIERQELNITTISLASVTDQFIAYLETMRDVPAGVIADFLVVAARLLLIKSRLLLPKPPVLDDDDEEDPGEALVRRLREYKRFKQAAQHLRGLEQARRHSYLRVAPLPVLESRLDLAGVSLHDLLAALSQVLETTPELASADPLVSPRKVTVHEKIELIARLVREGRAITFSEVLHNAGSRVEVVVSLWAVLEMIKRGRLQARQSELFGEITLHEPAPSGHEA